MDSSHRGTFLCSEENGIWLPDWTDSGVLMLLVERHLIIIIIILGTAHILRKVLTQKNKRANAGTRNRGTINNKDRIAVTMYPLGTWFVWGICVCIPCIKEIMMMMMTMMVIIIIIIIIIVSCHRPFLPGTSLEPAVIPTAQASSFTLQYFPYYVWRSKYIIIIIIIISPRYAGYLQLYTWTKPCYVVIRAILTKSQYFGRWYYRSL